MPEELESLRAEILEAVGAAADLTALEKVRVQTLGRKGAISQRLKELGRLPPERRREMGAALNALKQEVAEAIARRRQALEEEALAARLVREKLDVTLPPPPIPDGRIHPVSRVMDELVEIFADLGFSVAEGPHIEDDFHNFTALNIPEHHPARQMHDTFYFPPDPKTGERRLLRTHTSPVQIRTMLASPPPIRIIAPGRTFRADSDATHTPMFHQVEGLVIDHGIHMGHMKGTIEAWLSAFFGVEDIEMRLRPSYFPFTEPSAEVDVRCRFEGGRLIVGEGDDWLEVMGCGMVHPKVLENCGLDPAEWQGFAFGAGIDRLAMLKYGMTDLRPFFEGDLDWIRHYGFSPLDVPSLAGGV
ncbi:MAG: phenylalanine--tRNA ligase subunit alpha [Alphaproteobacteria bacterium]|nr:MAG: phenylalanine--tRNA ligase subunit alpha [Alphaproteobacteria bacterium]